MMPPSRLRGVTWRAVTLVVVAAVFPLAFGAYLLGRRLISYWKAQDDELLRRRASEEAIRLKMHSDRWTTGEMPDDPLPAEPSTAARIAATRRPLPPPEWKS